MSERIRRACDRRCGRRHQPRYISIAEGVGGMCVGTSLRRARGRTADKYSTHAMDRISPPSLSGMCSHESCSTDVQSPDFLPNQNVFQKRQKCFFHTHHEYAAQTYSHLELRLLVPFPTKKGRHFPEMKSGRKITGCRSSKLVQPITTPILL